MLFSGFSSLLTRCSLIWVTELPITGSTYFWSRELGFVKVLVVMSVAFMGVL